jgi:hypothetical protein
MMTNEQFVEEALALKTPDSFEPTAVYLPEGDCIEFVGKPCMFYAERLDDLVTVYYEQETNEIVGCLIKGVSRFIHDQMRGKPGFRILIQDRRVQLVFFFLSGIPADENDIVTKTYERLIKVSMDVEVDLPELCSA